MTLSRRGFLGGLAGLLSLLVWPWRGKPTPPEEMQGMWWPSWNESDDLFLYGKTQLRGELPDRFGGQQIDGIVFDEFGESPSVQALRDIDLVFQERLTFQGDGPIKLVSKAELHQRFTNLKSFRDAQDKLDAKTEQWLFEDDPPTHFQGFTKRYT